MLERQPIHIEWNFHLKSEPKQIWPYVSNTNRLFKNIRQPAVQQADITHTKKPGHAELSFNSINRYEAWIEEPCQWEYPYRFEIKRSYKSGPFNEIFLRVDLNPKKQGTRLQVTIQANPKIGILPYLATLKLKIFLKKRLKKTLRFYDKLAISGNPAYIYNRSKRLTRGSSKHLEEIKKALKDYPVNLKLFDKFIRFLKHADDTVLIRICPFNLARTWNEPVDDVLTFFICASKTGLLNFNWDLHCDKCRKVQATYQTLSQIHQTGICDHCKEEFLVNFNRSIQLSFTPHPLIRKINDSPYCIQGPQTKKHVLIQQYLGPGQKRYLKTQLPEGAYILRTSGSEGTADIQVCSEGKDTIYIGIYDSGLGGEKVKICPDPNLTIENSTETPQIITLEKAKWDENSLTAARITSFQLFRDQFGDEVLRKGEKIAAENLTLMFTDLFDSTGMYNKEGDDKAVGRVIDHFEILQKAVADERGAIVKTIGDSIMAVFFHPEQALRAYLKAHELIFMDEHFDNSLKLKAGIHHGSCVAVNLNSRIDYFGSTVNIASRLVDFASQNELMISDQALKQISLGKTLKQFENEYVVENITTGLKGFKNKSFRVKNIKLDSSNMRLAI